MSKIREARLTDVPAINHLRMQVRENILSDPSLVTEEMTAEAISVTGRGWVWEEEGDLLGFSIALIEDPSIWALFVLPDHEGRGIGHALLQEAVNWLWDKGVNRIWLGTDPGTRAERFYRDRAWVDSGKKENGEILFVLER